MMILSHAYKFVNENNKQNAICNFVQNRVCRRLYSANGLYNLTCNDQPCYGGYEGYTAGGDSLHDLRTVNCGRYLRHNGFFL